MDSRRPVRQGRAPLRLTAGRGRSVTDAPSSRPPRTGSIAAQRNPSLASHQRRSSRPPRTGSIAARPSAVAMWCAPIVVPSAKDGLHCGHRESSDLRGDEFAASSRPPRTGSIAARIGSVCSGYEGLVVPSAKDGLHCGHLVSECWSRTTPVVPSAKDGLHCGTSRRMCTGSSCTVVPSAKDGLHCGLPMPEGRGFLGASRPVRQGRAPLRLAQVGDHRSSPRVVPSAKDGLHCGECQVPGYGQDYSVVPSAKDGLHCGLLRTRRAGDQRDKSSRPPRTGSIAAAVRRWRSAAAIRSSRPPRTGSIAASPCSRSNPSSSGRPVRQGRAPLRPGYGDGQ